MYYAPITTPHRVAAMRSSAAVIQYRAENDNFPGKVRPLGESDVRHIAAQNAEILGAVIDVSPSFDVSSRYVLSVLSRVICDQPDIMREIVWRGTWFDREVVDQFPLDPLKMYTVEVVRLTTHEVDYDRLKSAIIDVLTPFSAYLRGELTA